MCVVCVFRILGRPNLKTIVLSFLFHQPLHSTESSRFYLVKSGSTNVLSQLQKPFFPVYMIVNKSVYLRKPIATWLLDRVLLDVLQETFQHDQTFISEAATENKYTVADQIEIHFFSLFIL